MFKRLFNPILNRSFFLFGARGVGKTSWLEQKFKNGKYFWINLLDEDQFEKYSLNPNLLNLELENLKKKPKLIIIDEVQRVPRLLNIVQKYIQKNKWIFILTGSSARKLKRGSANLLGGRANSYKLFPLSVIELGKKFNLQNILEWGSLPEIFSFTTDRERKAYLKSYCNNYLKEEILFEQLVRNLPPFRKFISILAQNEGKLINFEKFSRDVGVENQTIQSYIDILEDTYLGLLLRPHHPSLRKSQLKMPKFYFFDPGVVRQLSGVLGTPLLESTSSYGYSFESFVIQEIHRLNEYRELDYQLSYFCTKHGFEVDLILSRANESLFIEIKSTVSVDLFEVEHLEQSLSDIHPKPSRIIYLSRDPKNIKKGAVECMYYLDFFKKFT